MMNAITFDEFSNWHIHYGPADHEPFDRFGQFRHEHNMPANPATHTHDTEPVRSFAIRVTFRDGSINPGRAAQAIREHLFDTYNDDDSIESIIYVPETPAPVGGHLCPTCNDRYIPSGNECVLCAQRRRDEPRGPLTALRHYVSGAIERGEAEAIAELPPDAICDGYDEN